MNRHYKERHRYPWEDIQDVLSGKKLQDACSLYRKCIKEYAINY